MPWKKGQSGNPAGGGGYARAAMRLAEALRAGPLQEAVDSLVECLNSPDDRIQAAKEIIARSVGKPVEVLLALSEFSDDEIWAEMQRRLQAKGMNGNALQAPVEPKAQAQ